MLRAGTVGINGFQLESHLRSSGLEQPGSDRESGGSAVEARTELKSVFMLLADEMMTTSYAGKVGPEGHREMGRLAGKTALITGAARGQGAAAARRFVAEGARVMIADVADDEGAALADELGALYQHLDVSAEADWTSAVDRAVDEFGALTVLVNNAGILLFSELAKTSLEDYERVIRVNQIGSFLGMRSVVEPMAGAGGGSIVNVSSVEGLAAVPFLIAYTASKFAIRGMTKVAALELGNRNIRVNSVHPGVIDTQMVRDATGGAEIPAAWLGQRVALGRAGQPEEIADLVVFLASDESSYCTGAEFVADGGVTATHALKI